MGDCIPVSKLVEFFNEHADKLGTDKTRHAQMRRISYEKGQDPDADGDFRADLVGIQRVETLLNGLAALVITNSADAQGKLHIDALKEIE